jgi:hypothetical protein
VNEEHPPRILVLLTDNSAYVIKNPMIVEGELQGKQLKKGKYKPFFGEFEWYRYDPFFGDVEGNTSAGGVSKSIPLESIKRVEVWKLDGDLTGRRVTTVGLGILIVAAVAGLAVLIDFASDPIF